MAAIPPLIDFAPGTRGSSADVDANFAAIRAAFNDTAVLTDTARTVTAIHNFPLATLFGGDKIIEEGSNANGRWIKFAGGLMICYGTKDLGVFATANAQGAVWLGGPFSVTWPAAFVAAPEGVCFMNRSGNTFWCSTSSIAASNGVVYVVSTANLGAVDLDVMFIALGRWK